jgi:hypothetical protein
MDMYSMDASNALYRRLLNLVLEEAEAEVDYSDRWTGYPIENAARWQI